MFYEEIQSHIKNKFIKDENVKPIKFLNDIDLENMPDNKIYEATFVCLAIDIVNSKEQSKIIGYKNWSKIISEFTYGVEKIIKTLYNGKWITIQGDAIISIFNFNENYYIDDILECVCCINTFLKQINKNIEKYLEINEEIKIGIGLWLSSDNYVTKVGYSGERDIVFIGDSVNYAVTLANLANRYGNKILLLNDKFKENLENYEFLKQSYSLYDFNEKIWGWDLEQVKKFENYENFIINNI